MNFNPWNVASIDEFSCFNCPECTFHAKEKMSFQDHATRNHPLSAVLFSKEVITFLNELNQLKHLTNDQKCKELELKQKLPDPVSCVKNDVPNLEKRQQLQKVSEETKKDFSLPTEIVKIISLQKEEKLEKDIKAYLPSDNINENAKPEEVFEQINFSGVPVEVIEVDYNDFVQIDSLNSDVLISSMNCDEFQGFKANNPVLPSATELKVISASTNLKVSDKKINGRLKNCEICDRSFKSQRNLNNHIAAVHELKKPLECKICNKKFARKEKINQHVFTVHEKLKLFQCSVCDHKTSSKGNMKSHINSRHEGLDIEIIYLGDKNYKCFRCDFKTGLKET